jgi:hypothetical protein
MNKTDRTISKAHSFPATRICRFLAVPALLMGLNVVTASAEDHGCSDATLHGDYGYTITGSQPNPDGTLSPIKGVAITHYDGAGHLTQRDFVVTAGVPMASNGDAQSGFHFSTGETGSYSLNPDCTGTMEILLNVPVPPDSGLSSGIIKLMIVVTNRGRAIHTVVSEVIAPFTTAPGFNTTGSDAWKIESEHEPDRD